MFFLAIGILLASFGLKSFILPNGFIDGGITGLSILLSRIFPLPLAIFLPLVNLPFIFLAWFHLGKRFAISTVISILALALAVAFIDFPIITQDRLLSAIFGGILLGAGIGMAIRGQGTLDGTEILALLISKKTAFTVGNVITLFNVVIFSLAFIVIGIEAGLYSIITYIAASKSIDFLLYGFEELYAVTIVTPKYEEMKSTIFEKLERGVTVYNGEGGLSKEKIKIIYCVITKLEIYTLKNIISSVDDKSFFVFHVLKEAHGGLTQRRIMKH